MVAHEASIPQDWTMTSDGLAAWLAAHIQGAEVALVKACLIPPGAGLDTLSDLGITDPQFPRIVKAARLDWHVLGAGEE